MANNISDSEQNSSLSSDREELQQAFNFNFKTSLLKVYKRISLLKIAIKMRIDEKQR